MTRLGNEILEEHVETLLDEALAATFPASDAVSLAIGGGTDRLLP